MSAPLSPKHILFDLDGTLLDSYDAWVRVEFITRALARSSREIGFLKAYRGLKSVRPALESPDPSRVNLERTVAAFSASAGIPEEKARELLVKTVSGVFPLLERYFYPVPGAKDFVLWSHARFPITLATNPVWPLEQVLLRLKWSGLEGGLFQHITHSARMHACKPTAEYYHAVTALTGHKPEELLLVGNEVRKDLPATEIGMPVFILGKASVAEPITGQKAPAWRGTYAALQRLLIEGGAR